MNKKRFRIKFPQAQLVATHKLSLNVLMTTTLDNNHFTPRPPLYPDSKLEHRRTSVRIQSTQFFFSRDTDGTVSRRISHTNSFSTHFVVGYRDREGCYMYVSMRPTQSVVARVTLLHSYRQSTYRDRFVPIQGCMGVAYGMSISVELVEGC